jgi:hypothetical protein
MVITIQFLELKSDISYIPEVMVIIWYLNLTELSAFIDNQRDR